MESETLETLGPSEFSFAIMKVAVAQICESAGFRAAQSSALETLTRIATIYLQNLAKSATTSAATSGRTQSNIFDFVHALRHLSSNQGFAGASDHNVSLLESSPLTITTIYLRTLPKSVSDYDSVHALKQLPTNQGFAGGDSNPNVCLLASNPLIDIIKFVYSHREIPFAKPLPRPRRSQNSPLPQNPRNPKQNSYIPRWLPGFPDTSTYTEPRIQITGGLNRDTEMEKGKCIGKEEKDSKSGSTELPKERERVSFRMGEINKIGA